jgi:hypothetical protein
MMLAIESIGGNCPVQAEGVLDGFMFYFRARGTHWSFEVYDGGDAPWCITEKYSDEPFAAGWMSEDEAAAFIYKAADRYRSENGLQVEDDGQPSEQQEWHDYDPDC